MHICTIINNQKINIMQTVLTYFALFLTGLFLQAQSNTIEVTMSGFDSNDGKASVGLFVEEESFLRKPERALYAKIEDNKSKVTFTEIPDGVYAISVYHDENDNDEMDLIMGILPKEDTGTSNNPNTVMGPPKWEESTFEIKGGEVLSFNILID